MSSYLCAELFTGDVGRDVQYVTKLGINGLVREAMQANDAKHLAGLIHSYGGHPIASVRSPAAAQARLVPTALPTMFYDCTHDNPTPFEKQCATHVPCRCACATPRLVTHTAVCVCAAAPVTRPMRCPSPLWCRLPSVPSAL